MQDDAECRKEVARSFVENEKYYLASNEGGYISWCDFKQAGYTTYVLPITKEEYGLSKVATI